MMGLKGRSAVFAVALTAVVGVAGNAGANAKTAQQEACTSLFARHDGAMLGFAHDVLVGNTRQQAIDEKIAVGAMKQAGARRCSWSFSKQRGAA